jgi:hypothetical protein
MKEDCNMVAHDSSGANPRLRLVGEPLTPDQPPSPRPINTLQEALLNAEFLLADLEIHRADAIHRENAATAERFSLGEEIERCEQHITALQQELRRAVQRNLGVTTDA